MSLSSMRKRIFELTDSQLCIRRTGECASYGRYEEVEHHNVKIVMIIAQQ